jgi:hypothetical protein
MLFDIGLFSENSEAPHKVVTGHGKPCSFELPEMIRLPGKPHDLW